MKIRQSHLSGICGLILIFLPLNFSTSPPTHRSKCRTAKGTQGCLYRKNSIPLEQRKSLDDHFNRNGKKTDPISPPFRKKVMLYSRASLLHVQITKTVNATAQKGSEHAILELVSDNFGRLKIRAVKTNRYLCMNKKGQLVTKVKKSEFVETKAERCIFREQVTSDGYIQFQSVKYPQRYIGFSRKGHPINTVKGAKRNKPLYRKFLKKDWPEKRKRKPAGKQQQRRAIHQFSQLRKKIIRLLRTKLRL